MGKKKEQKLKEGWWRCLCLRGLPASFMFLSWWNIVGKEGEGVMWLRDGDFLEREVIDQKKKKAPKIVVINLSKWGNRYLSISIFESKRGGEEGTRRGEWEESQRNVSRGSSRRGGKALTQSVWLMTTIKVGKRGREEKKTETVMQGTWGWSKVMNIREKEKKKCWITNKTKKGCR